MCGIVYCEHKSSTPVSRSVIKRYKNQKGRGTQGFAYLGIKNGSVDVINRARTEDEILKKLESDLSNLVMFHHRFPTSTANVPEATHPIVVKNDSLDYDYYVVHNGVIQNSDDLRKKHENLGFVYNTIVKTVEVYEAGGNQYRGKETEKFNDSESLAIELARYFDGDSKYIGTRGSVAFVCMQTDKSGNPVKLFFGHNEGNPLVMENRPDFFCLKSEGEGQALVADVLYHLSYSDKERVIYQVPVSIGDFYKRPETHHTTPRSSDFDADEHWRKMGYQSTSGLYKTEYEKDMIKKGLQRGTDNIWRSKEENLIQGKCPLLPSPKDVDDETLDISFDASSRHSKEKFTDWDIADLCEYLAEIEDQIDEIQDDMFYVKQAGGNNEINEYDLAYYIKEKIAVEDAICYIESRQD